MGEKPIRNNSSDINVGQLLFRHIFEKLKEINHYLGGKNKAQALIVPDDPSPNVPKNFRRLLIGCFGEGHLPRKQQSHGETGNRN